MILNDVRMAVESSVITRIGRIPCQWFEKKIPLNVYIKTRVDAVASPKDDGLTGAFEKITVNLKRAMINADLRVISSTNGMSVGAGPSWASIAVKFVEIRIDDCNVMRVFEYDSVIGIFQRITVNPYPVKNDVIRSRQI